MSTDGPSRGARPLLQEGGREAASAASLGEGRTTAAGPPQDARPLRQDGGREAASAASLGECRPTASAPLRFLVSAAHKSSGKTTVSIGLAAALTARGRTVQTFKKGPDFIDPMWLTAASGRRCRNLDPWLSPNDEIVETFSRHAAGADVAPVEGNKGLSDLSLIHI